MEDPHTRKRKRTSHAAKGRKRDRLHAKANANSPAGQSLNEAPRSRRKIECSHEEGVLQGTYRQKVLPRGFSTVLTQASSDLEKKAKYYGVRHGREPGIYYSWPDVEKQTSGYQAVFASFSSSTEVEAFMNHEPQDCVYPACGKICKDAVDRGLAGIDGEDYIKLTGGCDCCHGPTGPVESLCLQCFNNSDHYVEKIVEEEGLVAEQASVLSSVADGKNVFFTGAAGTGKSKLIHAIQRFLRGLGAATNTIAPTGIAAINVNGQTMHSFASWDANASNISLEELCKRARGKRTRKKFNAADVLIIDEVSMIESNAFTRLSQAMQSAKSFVDRDRHCMPFGGVQLIVSGDFFQLPPVKPFEHCIVCGLELAKLDAGIRRCEDHGDFETSLQHSFNSPVWQALGLVTTQLQHAHRQDDPAFIAILSVLRKGQALTEPEEKTLSYHPNTVDRDQATKLLPTRQEVQKINDHYISKIVHPVINFKAVDTFKWEHDSHPELSNLSVRSGDNVSALHALSSHRLDFNAELKLGMLVLLVANVSQSQGLVNGSVGKIIGFVDMKDGNMPPAMKTGKENEAEPLKGQFIFGQHAKYQEADIRRFREQQPVDSQKWPVVLFKSGVKRVIFAACYISERGRSKPYSLLSRTQIPLIPGYALTVPKAQGMTMDAVAVDLARSWEPGQAYVDLSRARSLDGLIVDTLPARLVTADPAVEMFMEETFGDRKDGEGDEDDDFGIGSDEEAM